MLYGKPGWYHDQKNLTLSIYGSKVPDNVCGNNLPNYPRMNWSDTRSCLRYKEYINDHSESLPEVSIDSVQTHDEASRIVDCMATGMVNVMHECCNKVIIRKQSVYKGRFKPNNWWNNDCLVTRDRQRFWYGIWRSCGRPREGLVYLCYIAAKKMYRSPCNLAMKSNMNGIAHELNQLHRNKHIKKFWNLIRKTKQQSSSNEYINIAKLEEHFKNKFSDTSDKSEVVSLAEREVQNKYESIVNNLGVDKVFTRRMVKYYIAKLNSGSSPGIDGIMTEHLKYATESRIVNHPSSRLTLCLKFGIVPKSFSSGLLVPLLKKPTLDPSVPKNYRPVTISCTFSKILELYTLDASAGHQFSDLQFGFVPGRGTNMATALANDVISYRTKRGSIVYACSLDADFILVAMDVIPDHCWLLLAN